MSSPAPLESSINVERGTDLPLLSELAIIYGHLQFPFLRYTFDVKEEAT